MQKSPHGRPPPRLVGVMRVRNRLDIGGLFRLNPGFCVISQYTQSPEKGFWHPETLMVIFQRVMQVYNPCFNIDVFHSFSFCIPVLGARLQGQAADGGFRAS